MSKAVKRHFQLGFPWETQDPFLFCVYHLDTYPGGNEQMGPAASLEGRNLGNDFSPKDGWRMYHGHTVPGFPAHPHRGFETITMVNKGFCDHSDSLGAAGRFGQGDVQWMTAGRGVQHSEMFPLLNTGEPNTLELFQIWLNLPKKGKFADPHFKMLWHEDIPVVTREGVRIKVVCGKYKDTPAPLPAPDSWAAVAENEVAIWDIHMQPGTRFILPAATAGVNRTLYYYSGEGVELDDEPLSSGLGLELHPLSEPVIKNNAGSSHFLLLQGRPIDEPVAKYGPFVMNTDDEIQQALKEYRLTNFGGWPWPYPDNVHARESGRFALYPDGKREERSTRYEERSRK